MVIKGVKHLAEISRMFDVRSRQERFRYTLQREGSSNIIYWGHERTEEAAVHMATTYLNLLDNSIVNLDKPGPKAQRVPLVAPPAATQA